MANITNNTQPSFSGGIISSELFSRIDYSKLSSGVKQCQNFVIRPAGGAEYRTGTKYIADTASNNPSQEKLIPFIYNREDGLCLEFYHHGIAFFKDGKKVQSGGSDYTVVTPYDGPDIKDIKYCQDKNNLYLVHPKYAPAVLTRTSDTNWTYRALSFNPTITAPTISIASGSYYDSGAVHCPWDKWQYAVTSVVKDSNGNVTQESLPAYSNVISNDISLAAQPIEITVGVVSGATGYNIYRINGGKFYWVYYVDYSANSQTITDASFAANTSKMPHKQFNEFGVGNYPSAVGIWNQRLLLGNTPSKPDTFWGSCVKQFEDFTSSELNLANEAFELTFNSGTSDSIRDFVALDSLIVLTSTKIWRVTGNSVQNMNAVIESYSGTANISPFVSRKSILYLEASQNTVSNFIYSDELNGYTGAPLDTLCREMMDGYYIRDISFRDTPYGVMYCIRNDGSLLGLTYLREENIYAWHFHKTQGFFRNICAVDKNQLDDVYCIVERENGSYIELFQRYMTALDDIKDCWHLDCATQETTEWLTFSTTSTVTNTTVYKCYTSRIETSSFDPSYGTLQSVSTSWSPWYESGTLNNRIFCFALHFTNGTLCMGVDSIGNYSYSDFIYDTDASINSICYVRSHDKWYPCVARSSGSGLVWALPASMGGYGLYAIDSGSLAAANYPQTVDNDKFTTSISNGILTITAVYNANYAPSPITFEGVSITEGITKSRKFANAVGPGSSVYVINEVAGADVYNSSFEKIGITSSYVSGAIGYNNDTYYYDASGNLAQTTTESVTTYKYTNGPLVNDGTGVAYDNIGDAVGDYYTYVDDSTFTLDGSTYTLEPVDTPSITEVTGLSRFNGMKVTIVADANEYKDVEVTSGKVTLEQEASHVLVGLPYTGIIETIPFDRIYSDGNTSVGTNKKINDAVISYYQARGLSYGTNKVTGLWYGKNMDELFQIKSYIPETYSQTIPWESGKIQLKVADGFQMDTTLYVVQKSPFPALIQSITLGSTINGKN